MRSSVLPYSPTYLYARNPLCLKATGSPASSSLPENGFNDLGVGRDVDEPITRPGFRRDFLGAFIPHTQQDLLRLKAPGEKQEDPFLNYLVEHSSKQHKSLTVCHLTLHRHVPKTLALPDAPSTQEVEGAFTVVAPEDPIIGVLREMGAKLDKLFKEQLYTKNNLSLENEDDALKRKNNEFALYLEAKKLIRNLCTAYQRRQEQGNDLPDEACKQAFAEGRASTYRHGLSTDRAIEVLNDTTSEESEQAESAAATSSPSVNDTCDSQQVSVITFKEAIESLRSFIDEERNKKIKLDEITEKNPLRDFNHLVNETGGSEWSIRIALAAGGAVGAALAGTVYFILKCWNFSEKRQLDFQNAFRKTLKNDLEHALKLLASEVDMDPRGVNNNGQDNQYLRVDPNLAYVTGQVAGSLGTLSDSSAAQTDSINELRAELNGLRKDFRNALKQIGLPRNDSSTSLNSNASLASVPESLAIGQRQFVSPKTSSPTMPEESFPSASTTEGPRRPSTPELEELKDRIATLERTIIEERELSKQEKAELVALLEQREAAAKAREIKEQQERAREREEARIREEKTNALLAQIAAKLQQN